jgi:hypothetical protein
MEDVGGQVGGRSCGCVGVGLCVSSGNGRGMGGWIDQE